MSRLASDAREGCAKALWFALHVAGIAWFVATAWATGL